MRQDLREQCATAKPIGTATMRRALEVALFGPNAGHANDRRIWRTYYLPSSAIHGCSSHAVIPALFPRVTAA